MKKWMKRINEFIQIIGVDKILHFSFGGWMVSMISPLGPTAIFLMLLFVTAISYIKESYFDEEFDTLDILAGVLGGTFSSSIALIIL